MPRSNSRGGRNNNPSGRNQYSDWGLMDMVRDRPVAAAAAAAGAAAAGLFLWSKRSQISSQLNNLSEQIGDWTENMRSGDTSGTMDDTAGLTTTAQTTKRSGAGLAVGFGHPLGEHVARADEHEERPHEPRRAVAWKRRTAKHPRMHGMEGRREAPLFMPQERPQSPHRAAASLPSSCASREPPRRSHEGSRWQVPLPNRCRRPDRRRPRASAS